MCFCRSSHDSPGGQVVSSPSETEGKKQAAALEFRNKVVCLVSRYQFLQSVCVCVCAKASAK